MVDLRHRRPTDSRTEVSSNKQRVGLAAVAHGVEAVCLPHAYNKTESGTMRRVKAEKAAG